VKILVVGESQPWSSETFCSEIFKEMGCEVSQFDNKKPHSLFGDRSWLSLQGAERLAYDSFVSKQFYEECLRVRPDVIYMPKGENIHSSAIAEALQNTKARLVIWCPDHPFRADHTSMNMLQNLKQCDFFYIWGKFLVDSLRTAGCKNVDYLPFGFYPEYHNPETEIKPDDHDLYDSDVCFVGTWQTEREEALKCLAGFKLAIWGPRWSENLSKNSPLRKCLKGGSRYGTDMVKAFKCAKVVLNLLQPYNGSAHNARTIEATGIGGGVLVVRRTFEQARELFVEGDHLFCYETNQELVSTLADLLVDTRAFAAVSSRAKQQAHQYHLLRDRLKYIVSRL
jgi:spore maturation protein CgeB